MVLLQRKLYFSKNAERVQDFPGGANFFQGVQMLISIETHITCDFPGVGGRTPYPPSGFAHGHVRCYRHLRICNEYRLIQTMVAAHKQLVSAQLYCQ